MAISAMMGMMDDAGRAVFRLIGKTGPSKPSMAYDPKDPSAFMSSLRKGDQAAVEGMRKMHYGSFYSRAGRATGMNRLAERELMLKGKGLSGAIFGRPLKGLGVGLSHLKGLPYFVAGAGALESFMAPKGHKVAGFAKGAIRTMAFAAGDVAGSALAGPIGGFIVGSITEKIGAEVGEGIEYFTDFNRATKHVNMGGNYEDTRVAYTMRQRAAQEMGTSVMNARTWLGKEALLMHQ